MLKWIKDKFSKNKNEEEKIEALEVNIEENNEELEGKPEKNSNNLNEKLVGNEEDLEKELYDSKVKLDDSFKAKINDDIEDLKNIIKDECNENIELEKEKYEELKINTKDDNEEVKKEEIPKNLEEKNLDNPKKVSLFQRLKEGLGKTRKEVGIKINTVLGQYVKIDDEMLEDLEDILISADIGMQTTIKLIDNLRDTIIREKINDPSRVKDILKSETKKLMDGSLNSKIESTPPTIILVVGVNGVGKTTTIGKLSHRFKQEGKSVIVAAADTFRAAAIDQLKEWGKRADVDVISHSEGSDPAAVVYDGIEAAKSRNMDILICDTAGRLHNKKNLMNELEKINRIIDTKYPQANKETLLVLDATTGQNAMNQAKTFKEASDISAIALTKLDGTAKGGVVIALQSELKVPIKLIGVGEGIDDLQDFNIDDFVNAIFEE